MKNISRIAAAAVLFLSVIFMPWWFSFILAIAGILYFRNFYEALLAAFFMDAFYAVPEWKFGGITLVSFFAVLAVFISARYLKNNIFRPKAPYYHEKSAI